MPIHSTSEFQKANLQYQDSVINNRLSNLFEKNKQLKSSYDTSANQSRHEVHDDLIKEQEKTTIKFNELKAKQHARQEERFSSFNSVINKTADVTMNPFRQFISTAEGYEQGVSNVAGSFTSTLTNPLILVAVAGAGYYMYTQYN